MIYIDPAEIEDRVPNGILQKLQETCDYLNGLNDEETKKYVSNSDNCFWTSTRDYLKGLSNGKCWYTESMNPGFDLHVDHFRPKGEVKESRNGPRLYWYWFLAYSVDNFRLSCQYSNRVTVDWEMQEEGEGGGKGSHFPLMADCTHATKIEELDDEEPAIIDPCRDGDPQLLVFLPDGRAVAAPNLDAQSLERVEISTHLLNLNFPTFNEDRERLYNDIMEWVEAADAAKHIPIAFNKIKRHLEEATSLEAPYSSAARCFLRFFRDREWVEDIVQAWDN